MWVDQEFHLDPDFMRKLHETPVPWGGGLLSQATFYRTYSRQPDRSPFGVQEHFAHVIQRNIEGAMSIRKSWYKLIGRKWDERDMQIFGQEMAELAFDMKWLPPGRSLFAMGTGYPEERGNAALNNCGFVHVNGTLSDAAAWLMDHLMLGVGVGFRIDSSGYPMRAPVGEPELFAIPDTREGWVEATRRLIDSYEKEWGVDSKHPVIFDYSQLRPRGAPIRSFGGTASGPDPLRVMHTTVRRLLDAQCILEYPEQGTELIADVMNLIGVCVVAGNVRRSAEIAIGKAGDAVFVNLKNYGEWDDSANDWKTIGPAHHRMGWAYMSNNSVWMDSEVDFEAIPDLVDTLLQRGEPGFINGKLIQSYGRTQDKVGNGHPWLRPDYATGMNPCGEIPLWDRELCNLVEVFPTRITNKSEWYRALQAATFFASTVALLPSHDTSTNAVVAQNRRIGVSVSGVADWVDSTPFPRIHRWLDDGYDHVRLHNAELAKEAGVPASIRVTTVKPSGTVSLLPWVSPGMHHPVKSRFIRRVTVGINDPVAERLMVAGVPCEPLNTDPQNSLSFQFPMKSANGGRTRAVDAVPIAEQVALATFMGRIWADNAVSFTGTVSKRDIPYLKQIITMAIPQSKSMSFLVNQEEEQQYEQAPYEAITEAEYERRMKEITHEVDWSGFGGSDGIDSRYCDGEVCVI